MSYGQKRALAIAVSVCIGMLGAVALGNAETLGISPQVAAWLTVIGTGLGILQGFLPSVRGEDSQPEHIANRIMDLSQPDREVLISEVARRHQEEDAA